MWVECRNYKSMIISLIVQVQGAGITDISGSLWASGRYIQVIGKEAAKTK